VKRRRRELDQIEVPPRFADPHVEDYATPHEVHTLEQAQDLAADRHAEEWNSWYADQHTTMISVAVVLNRASLGTELVDDLVEMPTVSLVGITVAQTRRILLGEPLPFRDGASFEQAMRQGAP
jgi:hypothetical protein